MATADGLSTSARNEYERPALTEHSEWDIVTGSIGSGQVPPKKFQP